MDVSMHKTKIRQMISRQAISVSPDVPVIDAVILMSRLKISCLVVVDGKNPLGIFTERDLVRLASRGLAIGGCLMGEVMTSPVITIPGGLTLCEAYNLLLTNGIRHHVIVDRAGRVEGVVSQSDLIEHLGVEYFVEMRRIEQIMTAGVVVVAEHQRVREALVLMAAGSVSCVVAAQGEFPVGILSERDVSRLVAAGADLTARTVAETMTKPIRTVAVGSTVQHAVTTMKRHGIRRVVVTDDQGRIAGIVTQSDILKGLEGRHVEALKKLISTKADVLRGTARELLDKSLYLDGILRSSIDLAIVATDVDYRIKYFNPVAEKVFGCRTEEVVGTLATELRFPTGVAHTRLPEIREIVGTKGEYLFPLEVELDGVLRFYEGRVTGLPDRLNRLTGFVMVLRDDTERKRYEKKIEHLAYHDALTGLPNRVLFSDRISQALARASRSGSRGAVMILDLDDFKDINDTLGHGIGDLLLQAVSIRLKELVRKTDTVSRMGGDEFALLLSPVTEQEGAALVAGKIVRAFRHPFTCAGKSLRITGSVGIASFPEDGADEETLLKKADIALYLAKKEGRNRFRRWTAAAER